MVHIMMHFQWSALSALLSCCRLWHTNWPSQARPVLHHGSGLPNNPTYDVPQVLRAINEVRPLIDLVHNAVLSGNWAEIIEKMNLENTWARTCPLLRVSLFDIHIYETANLWLFSRANYQVRLSLAVWNDLGLVVFSSALYVPGADDQMSLKYSFFRFRS